MGAWNPQVSIRGQKYGICAKRHFFSVSYKMFPKLPTKGGDLDPVSPNLETTPDDDSNCDINDSDSDTAMFLLFIFAKIVKFVKL